MKAAEHEDPSDEAAVLGRGQQPVRARAKFRADLLIFALWVFICAPQATGLGLHEWVSFAFVPFFVLHLLLSWKWIVAVTRRFFKHVQGRTRFNYVWNLSLFVLMVACIVSGVLVSEVALPGIGIETRRDPFWRGLHETTANLLLLGVGVHLALHWTWIRSVAQRLRTGPSGGWRDGSWSAVVRPGPVLAILIAMVAVGAVAVPLESSRWAEDTRARQAERRMKKVQQSKAQQPEGSVSGDERGGSNALRKPRAQKKPNDIQWGRYVLPFVKQGILMGVPALICLGMLAMGAALRRRVRARTTRR